MNRLLTISLLTIAGTMMTACGGAADNKPVANANANAANTANSNTATTSAAPSTDALVALENKAFDAWKNKDGKFFDGFLAANFVGFDDHGKHVARADVSKMITEDKCEVKSFSLTDPHVTPVGANAAVLTAKATSDATCNGKAAPSPVISATVYVKEGDSWKAAYHNEVPIVEPKADKPVADKPVDKKPAPPPAKYEPAAASNVNAPANSTAKPAANTAANANTGAKPANLTAELTAMEKSGWEAWKAKDAKKFDEILAKDITFVDHVGKMTSGKDAVIKLWTDPACDVKSVDVTDSNATEITPGVAILTYKGKASGTCGGSPVTDLWGTTVSMKDGDTWKAVFILETPMAK